MSFFAPPQIILDVFGTLAFIGDQQRPFQRLLSSALGGDSEAARALGHRFLTEPISLPDAFERCGLALGDPLRESLSASLEQEIASIRLHADALAFVRCAHRLGCSVALCSNLALPYQAPVQSLLNEAGVPRLPFFSSFLIGCAKPDPRIYQFALESLGRAPEECFFVGDTPAADRDGPIACGLQAVLLDRKSRHGDPQSVPSFHELAGRWGWPPLTPQLASAGPKR